MTTYIRSFEETEGMIAMSADYGDAEARALVRAMRSGRDPEFLAGQLAVDLIRCGYRWNWSLCLVIAFDHLDECREAMNKTAGLKDTRAMFVRGLAVGAMESGGLDEEPDRPALALAIEQVRGHGIDPFEELPDGDRVTRQLRYFAMRNRAMRSRLEKGECVDLSRCARFQSAGEAGQWYVIPPDVWQDDVDYCNAETESWVWSVGRHLETGAIHASHSTELYQNDAYHCLWLR